jgi:hypothetical protein
MNLYKLHNNPEKLKYYHQISDKLNDNNVLVFKNVKGQIHRDGDKPAIIHANGNQYWYKDGKLHRDEDKPAIIRADGSQEWYKNDKRHGDDDKPAIIYANGQQEWWVNGRRIK